LPGLFNSLTVFLVLVRFLAIAASLSLAVFLLAAWDAEKDAPQFTSQLVFQPNSLPKYLSCRTSTLVELPDGELLAAWFAGTEEGASDTAELGARLTKGTSQWSTPTVLVDTPNKSEGNSVLHLDRRGRLWIFYVTKERTDREPQWAQCRVKCRVSADADRTFGLARILRQELG
jgi:predicted neuraminidase